MALVNPFTGYRPPVQPTPQQQAVTHTPDGAARVPGFFNPSNPYDTGRHGESNMEVLRRQGLPAEKVPGWDYDLERWKPGYGPSNPGFPGGGGSSAAGGSRLGASFVGMQGLSPFVQQLSQLLLGRSGVSSAPNASPGAPGWVAPSASDWVKQPGFYDEQPDQLPADPQTPAYQSNAPSLEALLRMVRQQTQAAKARVASIAR